MGCNAAEGTVVRWVGLRSCRMAARSSKEQWRAFLRDLIRQSNPGRECKLTQRQAFAKLSEKFGADVSASDRQWVKDVVCDIHTATCLRFRSFYTTLRLQSAEGVLPQMHYMYMCMSEYMCEHIPHVPATETPLLPALLRPSRLRHRDQLHTRILQ